MSLVHVGDTLKLVARTKVKFLVGSSLIDFTIYTNHTVIHNEVLNLTPSSVHLCSLSAILMLKQTLN